MHCSIYEMTTHSSGGNEPLNEPISVIAYGVHASQPLLLGLKYQCIMYVCIKYMDYMYVYVYIQSFILININS